MKRNWATLLSFLLVLPFGGAHALGLGEIEVRSALNEPLDATIPLQAVQAGDLENLQVSLGSQEQFDRAGIETGLDLDKLITIAKWLETDALKHPVESALSKVPS